MSKKNTCQTKPPAYTTEFDPMAEAERRIAEARQRNAAELELSGLQLTEVPAALGELRQLQYMQSQFDLVVLLKGAFPASLRDEESSNFKQKCG